MLFSVTKKDLRIEYYKASGKGGQNRNKRETAVRITHPDSEAVVTASEQRNQRQNLKTAFIRLTKHEKFKKWFRVEIARMTNNYQVDYKPDKKTQKWLDEQMKPENLKIEYL